jgi:hypothetical protein
MSPNWNQVRDQAESGGGGAPPDGIHVARLDRMVLNTDFDKVITEWVSEYEPRYWWTSWNGFEGQQLSYTLDLLKGLGMDMSTVSSDDEFERAGERVIGKVFTVRTDSRQYQGKTYVNTYVESPQQMDLPVDASDLPEPVPVAVSADPAPAQPAEDDDIPF